MGFQNTPSESTSAVCLFDTDINSHLMDSWYAKYLLLIETLFSFPCLILEALAMPSNWHLTSTSHPLFPSFGICSEKFIVFHPFTRVIFSRCQEKGLTVYFSSRIFLNYLAITFEHWHKSPQFT